MTDHASALLAAFIAPERRDRYLTLLASTKGRVKLRARLAHLRDLDDRYARLVPPSDQHPGAIAALLRAAGAPATCYLLSEAAALDGREMQLEDALEEVVGGGLGTFVSCLPGRLAYFEGEDPGARYVLSRGSLT